jgi:predicted P-loop ATPase/GTPase
MARSPNHRVNNTHHVETMKTKLRCNKRRRVLCTVTAEFRRVPLRSWVMLFISRVPPKIMVASQRRSPLGQFRRVASASSTESNKHVVITSHTNVREMCSHHLNWHNSRWCPREK